jgi:hypothetical protein
MEELECCGGVRGTTEGCIERQGPGFEGGPSRDVNDVLRLDLARGLEPPDSLSSGGGGHAATSMHIMDGRCGLALASSSSVIARGQVLIGSAAAGLRNDGRTQRPAPSHIGRPGGWMKCRAVLPDVRNRSTARLRNGRRRRSPQRPTTPCKARATSTKGHHQPGRANLRDPLRRSLPPPTAASFLHDLGVEPTIRSRWKSFWWLLLHTTTAAFERETPCLPLLHPPSISRAALSFSFFRGFVSAFAVCSSSAAGHTHVEESGILLVGRRPSHHLVVRPEKGDFRIRSEWLI